MTRHRLTNKQREELYDACRGEAELPSCNICGGLILRGMRWHQSHNPLLPAALGGEVTGIAHAKCNLDHGHKIATPQVAKNKRQRQKDIGAWRTSRPMVGSRASNIKFAMNGAVLNRATGQPWRSR